jgi:hypothetical protein
MTDTLNWIVGKTIASVDVFSDSNDDEITIHFTDGTSLKLTSWDYEGYSSGINLVRNQR